MDSIDKTRGVVSSAEQAWSWAAVTSASESAGLSWYVPCKLMQARTLAMNCQPSISLASCRASVKYARAWLYWRAQGPADHLRGG